jgi:deoxyribodipyrimidine photo-lyase
LSPYLHFGQISPLAVALAVKKGPRYGQAAFLEELIVRRELEPQFRPHKRAYDRFEGLPDWCRSTLIEHEKDPREFVYTRAEFERAATHDPYWNAAQKGNDADRQDARLHAHVLGQEDPGVVGLAAGGVPHGPRPQQQIRARRPGRQRLRGVAWCFGKHDRPWARRPIYGTIRTMTSGGLRRKFDADAYVRKIERMANTPG